MLCCFSMFGISGRGYGGEVGLGMLVNWGLFLLEIGRVDMI